MKIQVNKNRIMIAGMHQIAQRIADVFDGQVETDVVGKSTFCAISVPKTITVSYGNEVQIMSHIGEISFYQGHDYVEYSADMCKETGMNRLRYREVFQEILKQYK